MEYNIGIGADSIYSVEEAKSWLKYFKSVGYKYNTNLFEKAAFIAENEKSFLFIKYKKNKLMMLDELAKQICIVGKAFDYQRYIKSYFIRNDIDSEDIASFVPDEYTSSQDFVTLVMIKQDIDFVLEVYSKKKDTKEFDQISEELVNFLDKKVRLEENKTGKGVVVSVMYDVPKLYDTEKLFLNNILAENYEKYMFNNSLEKENNIKR